MPPETQPAASEVTVRRCMHIARGASVWAILIGLSVLAGWLLDFRPLMTVLPGFVAMKANTALAFCFAGLSLFLFLLSAEGQNRRWRTLSVALAVAVVTIGALTLGAYAAGTNLRIDELFFRDFAISGAPGRMAPLTAINFVCLGLALISLRLPKRTAWAHALSAWVAFTSLLAVVGYIFAVDSLYQPGQFTAVALHTAIGFLILSIGVWCASSRYGFMRLVTGSGTSGMLVRRYGLAVVVLPLLIGWLHMQGEVYGLFGEKSGAALFAMSNVVTFAGLVWLGARSLRETEHREALVQERLRQVHLDLEMRVLQRTSELAETNADLQAQILQRASAEHANEQIFANSLDVICTIDAAGHFLQVSRACETVWGYRPEELIGRRFLDFVYPDDREKTVAADTSVVRGEPTKDFENRYVRRDGSVVSMLWTANWSESEQINFCVARDITERKRGEEALRVSDERLRVALSASGTGTFRWDIRSNELSWDDSLDALFGLPPGQAIRSLETFIAAVHPDDRPGVIEHCQRCAQEGADFDMEFRVLWPDGSLRWLDDKGKTFFDDAGQSLYMTGACVDITERKRAEEALRKSEAEFRTLAEAMPQIVWFTRPDGWHLYFSQRWMDYTGLTLEESLGHGWNKPFHPEDQQRAWDAWQHARATIGTYSLECRLRRADGVYRWWLIRGVPQTDAAGHILKWFGTCTDIHDLKLSELEISRTNLELAAAKEAAEAANRAKSEFLANMSHEIRTPMNGIIGMTNLMLDTELSDQQQHYADAISKSGESLLSIINDILDFSKIEAGKLSFETIDFNLYEGVENCLELLAQRAQEKNLELACLIETNVPTRLRGDAGRLCQVLTNLISNAIKFTEHGEVVVRVSVEKQTAAEAFLRFEVKDTGIGISPEAKARLFQPFSQADASMSRKFGGTGLGLAISKQLVDIMKGELGVESTPGRGSTFWFTARLARQPTDSNSHSVIRGDLTDLHVLIVDDNETNREILQHHTNAWKMRSEAVANAADALDELRRAQAANDSYQAVLLDLVMPGTDGLALARSIRAERALSDLRLVLLSSMGQWLSAEELRDAGIDDCLTKPAKQSLLFDCLARLIGGAPNRLATQAKKVSPAPNSPAPAKQKLRILLAEDNIVNQEVAQGLLRKRGYRADAVANGNEVLETLQQIRYDVILMDCQMPELDGYEATRRIRQLEQKRIKPFDCKTPIHIIAMTANAMQGDRKECLSAGMNDYLSKPVRDSELKAALERCPVVEAPSGDGKNSGEPNESSSEEPAVDIERLRDVADNEPVLMRRLITLYLDQTAPMLEDLHTAIETNSSGEVARLAHKLAGSSVSCGVEAFTQPLRELEQLGREGDLTRAATLFDDVREKFPNVRSAFDHFLQTIPGDS